jgi:hypothetical protein
MTYCLYIYYNYCAEEEKRKKEERRKKKEERRKKKEERRKNLVLHFEILEDCLNDHVSLA